MMADFAVRHLGILGYHAGFTLWAYLGKQATLAEIQREGFFNPVSDMLGTGDRIMVSATDGACDLHVASASKAGGVVVQALSATGMA